MAIKSFVERGLKVKASQFNPDPTLAMATPLIILPDMNEIDIDREWDNMMVRSLASDQLIQGKISISDYLDVVDHFGIDVPSYLDCWENNLEFVIDSLE